jgi:hypothetical protein
VAGYLWSNTDTREESPLEQELDGEDFDIYSDEEEVQGFRGMVPPQGAPTGGPRPKGSSVLSEEMAGVWPLGPSEMMTLRGVLPRRQDPRVSGGA